MKAKTYAIDDIIVVVMRGSGFTPLEKTIMDSGQPERVVSMRHDFQTIMAKQFTDTIEELTGRHVTAFLSQAHVDPDISIEIFFIDEPLEGFAAVQITEPDNSRIPSGPIETTIIDRLCGGTDRRRPDLTADDLPAAHRA